MAKSHARAQARAGVCERLCNGFQEAREKVSDDVKLTCTQRAGLRRKACLFPMATFFSACLRHIRIVHVFRDTSKTAFPPGLHNLIGYCFSRTLYTGSAGVSISFALDGAVSCFWTLGNAYPARLILCNIYQLERSCLRHLQSLVIYIRGVNSDSHRLILSETTILSALPTRLFAPRRRATGGRITI